MFQSAMVPLPIHPFIPKAQHKIWHRVGVQSISAELMYKFNKQIHEFLLESTLALSLS